MTNTLLEDVKTDRMVFELPSSEVGLVGAHQLRVVEMGPPEVADTKMCAQCIGECKIH